jgi:hypothetical protein
MKVEFELIGSERSIALKIIPETVFEETFIRRASAWGTPITEHPEFGALLMLNTHLIVDDSNARGKE